MTRNGPSRNHEPARILQQFTDKYEYSWSCHIMPRCSNLGNSSSRRLFSALLVSGPKLRGLPGYDFGSDSTRMPLAFFLPKYWVTWVGLAVMRTVELLPFAVQRDRKSVV